VFTRENTHDLGCGGIADSYKFMFSGSVGVLEAHVLPSRKLVRSAVPVFVHMLCSEMTDPTDAVLLSKRQYLDDCTGVLISP